MDRALPDDTRGIVDPGAMLRVVDFGRYPPGDALDGLVAWFWSVSWDLPDGVVHDQQVLTHPAGNISVGTLDDVGVPLDPPEGRVYGVQTSISQRHLTGAGWTVAARTTVGGLGALLDRPAREAADRQLTFAEALPGLDGPTLVAEIAGVGPDSATGAGDGAGAGASTTAIAQRVDRLRDALSELVTRRDPGLTAEAREVADLNRLVERDRTICRVEQMASLASTSVRSLQRLFDIHVGASPSFVIRRWRIIEAAEAARTTSDSKRGDGWRGWASVAAELGYADQAHLARDFVRHLGVTPSAYLAKTRAVDLSPPPARS